MRPKYPTVKMVNAIGLPDAWSQLVNTCITEGALKKRFYGKPVNTYDIISLTEIKHPLLEPMLHKQFPTKELHCTEYEKQWKRDYDWKKQGFEYNYMDRLIKYPCTPDFDNLIDNEHYHKSLIDDEYFIDQLKVIKENIAKRIEKGGECLVSNRDETITWIPDRDMFVKEDQPCLQRLQIFVYKFPEIEKSYEGAFNDIPREVYSVREKGKAEFHCMWRSRDLFTAWNTNMIGLIKMLMKEIFEPNNLELIKVVDFCNSNHIYESDWDAASLVKPMGINPQFMR